jgi:probable HAF family extracellular repeat protein
MRAARMVNDWTRAWGLALLSLGISPIFAAQAQQDTLRDRTEQGDDLATHNPMHHHYKLIDVGTFGGPWSLFSNPGSRVINSRGTAVGVADTSAPDPTGFFDGFIDQAFVFKDGVTTDLGTLPGGASSFAVWINNRGLIVGQSQIGSIDPFTGLPELRGILWRNEERIDLGTLGGNASSANAINDRGQAVGGALTATPDPFANVPQASCKFLTTTQDGCSGSTFAYNALFSNSTTETHAFLWQDGVMLDLGTLGGPDSNALINNNQGQVAGWSYSSFDANAPTGVPTVDPFIWSPEDGKMVNLGGLGGTFGAPLFMNSQGQVIGVSNLPGDQTFHPFLWNRGTLQDLGTLGGYTGIAFWVNDAGVVVGYADLPPTPSGCKGLDCVHHAFVWKDGLMRDLGTLGNDQCSRALSINLRGQVVGATSPCHGEFAHAFLWEKHGAMIDLNTLVLHGSQFTVRKADYISERGEIAGRAVLPNGHVHAVLLIPCDDGHPDIDGCDYNSEE